MRIDAFPHIVPPKFMERVRRLAPGSYPPSQVGVRPSLYDLEARFRIMDAFPDYVQVLTMSQPPLDSIGDGSQAVELAKWANDELAEICLRHPDRFLGFAAALPFGFPDAAQVELDRATRDLGALGAQIHTNVRGVALDDPRFAPFWARMAELDRPVWVHPMRTAEFPDYATERASKFGAFIALGWPYETSVFMFRLVYSGIMDHFPGLRILTHHCGGMIPHFHQRAGKGTGSEGARDVEAGLHRFYGDTALNGSLPAVECGLAYFGVDRVLFGTDMPYGEDDGTAYVRDTIANVEALALSSADRAKIFEHNARRVLRLS